MSKTVYIYTDGSALNKTRSKGGYGILLKYKQHEKQYHFGQYYNTSSARMELRAVIHALKLITNTSFRIKLYSDNMYCVKSVSMEWIYKWEKEGWIKRPNKDLLQQLLVELRRFQPGYIEFIHIKGHSGHKYNEICDKLAKAGSKIKILVNDLPIETM